jgi:hypothetical protein
MQTRAPEGFININVSETGNESLVQEQALQPTSAPFQVAGKARYGEGRLQRLRPVPAQRRLVEWIKRA